MIRVNCRWLQDLDVSGNRLRSLPPSLQALCELQMLNVSCNCLWDSSPPTLRSTRALFAELERMGIGVISEPQLPFVVCEGEGSRAGGAIAGL